MAYATKMAAALSGATTHQLRHWRSPRTGPLLVPEIAATPRALYSFQDVLALRTFVKLRENASLQKIRAAIGHLRNLGEVGPLASYQLVSDRRGDIQLLTEDQAVNLTSKPGQLQLIAVIGDVIEPFAVRAGVVVPHLLHPRPLLAVDPETQGGTPARRSSTGQGCRTTRSLASCATESQPNRSRSTFLLSRPRPPGTPLTSRATSTATTLCGWRFDAASCR